MKKISLLLIILMQATLFASKPSNLAAIYEQLGLSQDISYSAEMVMSTAKGSTPVKMKMYYSKGDIRTEGEQEGMRFVMIMKKDGEMLTYNDAMKMWIKTSMNDIMEDDQMPKYKKIGEEDIEGKKAIRYEFEDPATKLKTVVWVADGMIIRNKNITPNGAEQIITYENVKKGDLDQALFSPPAGESVQDMTQMMKNMMQQVQSQAAQQ